MLHFYSSVRELTVSKLDQSSKQPMANPSKMPNLQLFRGLLKNNLNVSGRASVGVLSTSNIFIFPRYISTNQFNRSIG